MMKRNTFAMLFSLLMIATCLFASCNADQKIFEESSSDGDFSNVSTYDTVIRQLEDQIIELQQGQYISDSKNQQEIERLQALLAELKGSAGTGEEPSSKPSQDSDTDNKNQNNSTAKFLYTVEGENATITGYTGQDKTLIIPSVIDGYKITSIADGAFEGSEFESVIISDGIVKIGWFSFQNCANLRSVTMSSGVQSIGYSAFSGASEHLTIYAPSESFALQYARSYGFGAIAV